MSKRIKIVNQGRDALHFELPVLEADGKPKRKPDGEIVRKPFVLGSTDDRKVEGAPQPELIVEEDEWARLCEQKAVAGMMEDGKIAAYPMA